MKPKLDEAPNIGQAHPAPTAQAMTLNTEDAAAYVGLSASTMEKLRVSGEGPRYAKLGRLVRYERITDRVAELLADLSDAGAIKVERRGGAGRSIVIYADRFDDSDEISRKLQAEMPARFAPSPAGRPAKGNHPAAAEIRHPQPVPASKEIIPFKPRRKAAKGAMPSIEWVQLDRLQVDDSYQRSIDTRPSAALIKRIGDEWDWRLCVPLMVSRRVDGLYVIDGQHRLHGARLRDDVPQLPCCISVYDGPADEAAMFVAANRERRAMNRLDDFHAAQAGGDADALAVAALIESVGFTVSRRTGSAAWVPGEVAFTSAISTMRRKHGDGICRAALQAMADAFPGQRLVAGSSVFTATARILVNPPPAFDRERLFRALRTFDMPGWADFLTKAKGGDERAQRLRDMLLAAYDDLGRPEVTA